MASHLFVLATVICVIQLTCAQGVDKTKQEGASGTSVVQVVVNRITAVFGSDNQFLRRVAYVESKDGTDRNTYRSNYHGGIWQVDEIGFRSTQDVNSHPGLVSKHNKIKQNFGIDWTNVQWRDLRKPLYSGTAARLFLSNVASIIPCDIQGQARYWKTYYNRNGAGTEQKFISDVQSLSQTQGCNVNSDVMFVLDASGSIGERNFDLVRQFVLLFINRFSIGPTDNQVGVIVFSSTARLIFDFDRYRDKSSLSSAVGRLTYSGFSTNIQDALCKLFKAYKSNFTGARMDSSVFRIAILMTDGQSTESSNQCGFSSVAEAARAVHAISPPVLVFAFGVGTEYDPDDVRVIASGPEYISSAQSFSTSQLDCVQAIQEDNLCYRISTPVSLAAVNNGSLEQGEQIRWEIKVPETGITFTLKVKQGRVVLYASTETTAPNDAFYEWKTETSSTSRVRITPVRKEDSNVNKRAVDGNTNASVPVYMTLSGLEGFNAFSLQSGATKQEVFKLLFLATTLASALLAWQK